MEDRMSENKRVFTIKNLKDSISNDPALKKKLTSTQGALHSPEIFDLFTWNLAISFAVGVFSSITADKLKDKLGKKLTLSKRELRELMPLLEKNLGTPDLSKVEEGIEYSKEVMFSFNLEDTDKRLEIKMRDSIKRDRSVKNGKCD